MISRETFLNLYNYNYWARDQQLQACVALDENQFRRPLGSSFPSVQATLAHMVEAEWTWSERWHGRSPTNRDAELFAPERFLTVTNVQERWRSVEESVRRFLTGLKKGELTQELRYVNRKGKSWAYPLWQALFHLVNHQTYHRGQITTMLRQLGITPPQIDYLVAYDHGLRA